jgi:hypothetical protein
MSAGSNAVTAASGKDGMGEPGGFGAGAGAGGSGSGAGGGGLGAGGDIFIAQGGTLTVDGGLLSAGTVEPGKSASQPGGAYGSGIFIQGNETITLGAPAGAGNRLMVDGVIADQTGSGGKGSTAGTGALIIDNIGTVELAAKNTFMGGIVIASGTLDLAHTGAAGGGAIRFDPGRLAFSASDAPTVPIENFRAGDTLEITGFSYTGKSYTGSTLTLDGPGGPVKLTMPDIGSADLTYAVVDGNTVLGSTQAPCFLIGTRIATARGAVPVEELRVGDLARIAGGGFRPVQWIGSRRVDPARHPKPESVAPVRIRRGAFGIGIPHRDLFLSPDHAVFADGVLIPVKYLINGTAVSQDPAFGAIDYFHVELDRHDVLLAEGLPVESYLETGQRAAFDNGGPPMLLHPDFGARVWEAAGCAPLVVTGPKLNAVRCRLMQISWIGERPIGGSAAIDCKPEMATKF